MSAQKKEPDIHIYWAGAKRYQIGNFRPEVKDGGSIIQPEQPLTIWGHVLQLDKNNADDRKKITFIEKSTAFKDGEVVRMESIAEANKRTAALQHSRTQQMQQNKDEVSESPEQVKVSIVASASASA